MSFTVHFVITHIGGQFKIRQIENSIIIVIFYVFILTLFLSYITSSILNRSRFKVYFKRTVIVVLKMKFRT